MIIRRLSKWQRLCILVVGASVVASAFVGLATWYFSKDEKNEENIKSEGVINNIMIEEKTESSEVVVLLYIIVGLLIVAIGSKIISRLVRMCQKKGIERNIVEA